MGNLTKNQLKRELMKVKVEQEKQSTLDSLSFQFNTTRAKEAIKPTKSIGINCLTEAIKEDELALNIEFSLLPSKMSFSKVNLDLYFQEQLINSTTLRIPQSALLNDSLQFPQILDMTGIGAGDYLIRVEMYELWSDGEKLSWTSKELKLHYTPVNRQDRYIKIPTVKTVAGVGLEVVSQSEKSVYRGIEEDRKKELESKRDEW